MSGLGKLGIISSAVVLFLGVMCQGDVTLPTLFSDHMVVQRGEPVPVWGWAGPGEKVTVAFGQMAPETALAGDNGEWRVNLPAMEAGGPFQMTVKGANQLTLSDVYVGEVWLCSGQSNMEWTVAKALNPEVEKAAANHPLIRHILVPKKPTGIAQKDVPACSWQVCSPDTVLGFSAAAYFFGREIQKSLEVPVGLIHSSWGGTRIEPWTPPVGFEAIPPLQDIYKKLILTDPATDEYKSVLGGYITALEAWGREAKGSLEVRKSLTPPPAFPKSIMPYTDRQQPSTLYNGMIHGLIPYGIRGAIWYQGESNRADGTLYYEKMRALIHGWRALWKKPDMPFYFVQVAPYKYGNEDPFVLPRLWEAQAKAATLPGVGMVVINDIGNINNIHPANKQEVGRRLSLLALARTYGRADMVYLGPTFRKMDIEGERLRLHFDGVGSGLASRDGKPLSHFEIIGAETDFVPATAVIDGETVVLSSPEVKAPVAMRFAWHKLAEPNLMNKEGLPAGPFRAGEVPDRDYLSLRIGESKDYTLVYDLDLAKLGKDIKYDVNNSSAVSGAFDRIAYFLELQKTGESMQYVYVSMGAFTDDISKIGIPTLASKANFQQKVSKMNVGSNVPGIVTGGDIATGNIEFWPNNYSHRNQKGIPGASNDIWDFGDQCTSPVDGHGCMQVHNYGAKQTLFAINQWKSGGQRAEMGIGNSPGIARDGNPNTARTHDWTFESNASQYSVKRLRVLVRQK